MKIQLEEDFIYTYAKGEAVLILRNCTNSCKFCPAVRLKPFQNYGKLHSSFDFSCEKLSIYGNANCSYIETFLRKLRESNPNVEIHLYGCQCNFSQKIDLIYHHIIHPSMPNYFRIVPVDFIIPAMGEEIALLAYALKYFNRYPEIPIRIEILDSGDLTAEFLSLEKVNELQKQINLKEFRI